MLFTRCVGFVFTCHSRVLSGFSALFEFLCDLIYNITTTSIHSTVQELVFEAVLKQELAFFDSRKPGKSMCMLSTGSTHVHSYHLQINLFDTQLIFSNTSQTSL